jgi:hypothetical protein
MMLYIRNHDNLSTLEIIPILISVSTSMRIASRFL